MLEMRPSCECCDVDLPAEQGGAFICSFECTYCQHCAEHTLHGICPNCGGSLVARPPRAAPRLAAYPPSPRRIVKAGGCVQGEEAATTAPGGSV